MLVGRVQQTCGVEMQIPTPNSGRLAFLEVVCCCARPNAILIRRALWRLPIGGTFIQRSLVTTPVSNE